MKTLLTLCFILTSASAHAATVECSPLNFRYGTFSNGPINQQDAVLTIDTTRKAVTATAVNSNFQPVQKDIRLTKIDRNREGHPSNVIFFTNSTTGDDIGMIDATQVEIEVNGSKRILAFFKMKDSQAPQKMISCDLGVLNLPSM